MARPVTADLRREQILQGLFEAVATGGLRGASVTEIAEAAGVKRSALHYFFSSKEEILVALIQRLGRRYLDELRERLARAKETRGRRDVVADLVRWHFRGSGPRTEQLMTVWIDFWGAAPTHPGIQAAVYEIQEGARAVFEDAVAFARPALAAAPRAQRRAWAASLLALVEGGLLQWRVALASSAPLALADLERAVDGLASSWLASLSFDPVPLGGVHADG